MSNWLQSNKKLVIFTGVALVVGGVVGVLLIGFLISYSASTRYYGGSQVSLDKSAWTDEGAAYEVSEVASEPASGTSYSSSSTTTSSRKEITTSYLSMVVKDTKQVGKQVVSYVEGQGGYVVSQYYSQPEEGSSAKMTVAVPAAKLSQAMDQFRGLSIKVTEEQIKGYDITDQYEDIKAKLSTLYTTMAKFEDMLDKAKTVKDTLTVQKEIQSLQRQIDTLKGRQQYLDKASAYSKVTIYMSTDEYALPYAPVDSWSARTVFKQAVRALVKFGRGLASIAIWVVVFGVVWVPVAVLIVVLKRRRKRKKQIANSKK